MVAAVRSVVCGATTQEAHINHTRKLDSKAHNHAWAAFPDFLTEMQRNALKSGVRQRKAHECEYSQLGYGTQQSEASSRCNVMHCGATPPNLLGETR
jgi:hypothetical protein